MNENEIKEIIKLSGLSEIQLEESKIKVARKLEAELNIKILPTIH